MVLRNKIDKWLATILDKDLVKDIKRDTIVTGGAITSLVSGEKPNDYDVYFKTKETAYKVALYYCNIFNITRKLKSVNEYSAIVKRENVVNIKDEVEERILIYMASAGMASEDQKRYTYFERDTDTATETFFNALTEGNPLDNAEELKKESNE